MKLSIVFQAKKNEQVIYKMTETCSYDKMVSIKIVTE